MSTKMILARLEQLVRECAEKEREIASLHDERTHYQAELEAVALERDDFRKAYNRIESTLGHVRDDRDYHLRSVESLTRQVNGLKAQLPPMIPSHEWEALADQLVSGDVMTPADPANGWTQPRWEFKIKRIGEFRAKTGAGLKEAKDIIEAAASRKVARVETLGDVIKSKLGAPKAAECPDDCDCKGGHG